MRGPDWERRIHCRLTDTDGAGPAHRASGSGAVHATGAVGHVGLSWNPVPGPAGYLIERVDGGDGQPQILHHGGSDVPAVPGRLFADTHPGRHVRRGDGRLRRHRRSVH